MGFIGMAIGCIIGGNIAARFSLKKILAWSNLGTMVASTMKLILHSQIIFVGHFLFGLFNGISQVTAAIAMHETIPGHMF